MPKHDFSTLRSHYPEIIEKMPTVFTSHEFIQALSRKYQAEYIDALFEYRDSLHMGKKAPFMMVHTQLATLLHTFPDLIEFVRQDVPSKDVFGQSNHCSEWRKVA